MALPKQVRDWFIPLSQGELTLAEAFTHMRSIALDQGSIPLIVQLVENPKFNLLGIEIFNGATDLETHDYIHLLLGRGVLPKDEAFVLGFTMGSTNRVGDLKNFLYGIFSRYLYPKHYQFTAEDFELFKDAVKLGHISHCTPLDKVDYKSISHLSLDQARARIGINKKLLQAFYEIEATRYPDSPASQRLLC